MGDRPSSAQVLSADYTDFRRFQVPYTNGNGCICASTLGGHQLEICVNRRDRRIKMNCERAPSSGIPLFFDFPHRFWDIVSERSRPGATLGPSMTSILNATLAARFFARPEGPHLCLKNAEAPLEPHVLSAAGERRLSRRLRGGAISLSLAWYYSARRSTAYRRVAHRAALEHRRN
jgi:hypothetical protein